MVPDLIWASDFFGPQEIWSPKQFGPQEIWYPRNVVTRNLVSVWKWLNNFHVGIKFPGAQKSGAQMISRTISVTALKMTPRQEAQPNALLFDNLVVFEVHLFQAFVAYRTWETEAMNTLFLCQRLFEVAYKLKCFPYYEAQIPHYGLWKREFSHN